MSSEVPGKQKIFHKYQFLCKGGFFFQTKGQNPLVDYEINLVGYN